MVLRKSTPTTKVLAPTSVCEYIAGARQSLKRGCLHDVGYLLKLAKPKPASVGFFGEAGFS